MSDAGGPGNVAIGASVVAMQESGGICRGAVAGRIGASTASRARTVIAAFTEAEGEIVVGRVVGAVGGKLKDGDVGSGITIGQKVHLIIGPSDVTDEVVIGGQVVNLHGTGRLEDPPSVGAGAVDSAATGQRIAGFGCAFGPIAKHGAMRGRAP